jgi:hypothetical protein
MSVVMRPTLLRRQDPAAREALQALLGDRVDCTLAVTTIATA